MSVRQLPFVVAMLLSVPILFTPESGVPTAPPGTDKVVHFTLFAAMALTGLYARLPRLPLVVGLAIYAPLSEILQVALPLGRSFGVDDIVADLVGLAAAVLVGWLLARRAARRSTGRSDSDSSRRPG
ncbi:VanZ family protein [Streptoalloteichus hindustanus]|uniref:VanZ like family protein n=1 Tax=Streptoalloteichus hindustanus TaxID=2017 RepID=A0A1M5AL30_STRHI|nr:VanZ family protein [Streptoalloteichus hindustanus]SHF30971.1 VanZ like family protein [Streptoalloteichus hindustanus]